MSRQNKESAVQFLKLVVEGRVDEAYDSFVAMEGIHHNAYFPAGFTALREAMKANHIQFPDKRIDIINALSDGDLTAVHSHIMTGPGGPGIVAVHLFRFEKGKIAEMWDVGQPVPPDTLNKDGLF